MKILCIGDAMIPGVDFTTAAQALGTADYVTADWESDWANLQHRRLVVEQQGPSVEPVPGVFLENPDAEMVLALFCPFSEQAMDAMPNLKVIGVARAGTENVDVQAATQRGIAVVNVMGRNAEAVSDFAVGLMLSEGRNIARAHAAIKQGAWRKEFSNSSYVPELKGKTVGIVGYGYIGRLVAQKLSGFGVHAMVYDPWVDKAQAEQTGVEVVDKETLFKSADFITLHARLTEDSKNLVSHRELDLMKPTAYLINTARAGLVDMDALVSALQEGKIAGAALDVFEVEPIPAGHPLLELDNVTLTTHIAGTTREALTRSPQLLVQEVAKLLDGQGEQATVKNKNVLANLETSWVKDASKRLGRVR
ncbi:2-hydroxyacid dehydrogenase [Alicyclobacillus tolerans]|uniref:2-hydroxyacid dehydrogenase n=1 Tax=Alicyclobacillus tolerans TaxID=90970 RepID=UPI001F2AF7F6|nr:2-hydroxyacid dehydrogenase [Alicyclobacillus tolerans]MCF8565830.1 2-hydroxyacid dehydrogenase [Alicyclobacillus tolerans]